MYFITKKDSETGKKFQEIDRRRTECYEGQKAMADEYGFDKWRYGWHVVFGGISACVFNEAPDEKLWKRVKGTNEWFPRLNVIAGIAIAKRFETLPTVSRFELNMCIGFEDDLNRIGFAFSNEEYVGIEVDEEWEIKMPKDCKEVTVTKYRSIFPTK